MSSSLSQIFTTFTTNYAAHTPSRLKIIDVFLAYITLTAISQFAYVVIVGTFPFNSFLAGFLCTVGCFVLSVCLRIQVNPNNKSNFKAISPERAYVDFLFSNIVLFLVVMNFMG
eukprot:TRINITY_DN11445_c0_g1_i1.p1 TRINITY_DN11445_c0_g1~~TRINITY_DN11445_c0_g1_i1.p1  ORF type:complete len:123 (-),score=30.88 TRINITY_DN11445_c0_g1_i1:20-361(-)